MTHRTFKAGAILVTAILVLGAWGRPGLASGRLDQLKKHIEAACADKTGRVGVALKHLESGEELALNGDEPFPMASTFKLPVLVEVLAQVKEGRFRLDDELAVLPGDRHLGSGMISSLTAPGIKLSVLNTAKLMMMISDNSAADMLLAKVGPENVNKRLAQFGIQGLSVNRSCQKLILDLYGLDYERYKTADVIEVEAAYQAEVRAHPAHADEVRRNFSKNLEDQSTPRAMVALLEKLFKKEILDPGSCDMALAIMLDCQTGLGRIKGLLPPVASVSHKTGTIDGTANDVGIIALPDGLGHVALAVMSKDFTLDSIEIEKIISQVGRFVYDYFVFSK